MFAKVFLFALLCGFFLFYFYLLSLTSLFGVPLRDYRTTAADNVTNSDVTFVAMMMQYLENFPYSFYTHKVVP